MKRTALPVLGVVFDGDDTLWSTERLYDEARAEARAVVVAAGLNGDDWETLERQLDVENVATMGYSKHRFPTSCIQAYEALCRARGVASDALTATRVGAAARSVFHRDPPNVAGAREILLYLRAHGVRLALLTKGDREVQERRIARSGLSHLFDIVRVAPEKSASTIREVVESLGVGVESAVMVGNSVRSDMLPALAAGLRAAWIDAHVWEHERSHDHLADHRIATLSSLADVPAILAA